MSDRVQVKVLCTRFNPEEKWVGWIDAYVNVEVGDLIDCPISDHAPEHNNGDLHTAKVIDV